METAAWPKDSRVRPPPVIEGVREDESGFLWGLLRDAASDWRPPYRAEAAEARPLVADEYDERYDWLLEAVDVESGLVIATRRFPKALWISDQGPFLASRSWGAHAATVARDVWRPFLVPTEELP